MFSNTFKSTTATLAFVLGLVLLIVGILGFFNDPVLGIFQVDTLHNLVHILSGLLLLGYGATGPKNARNAFLIIGAVYAVVTLLGFLTVNMDPDKLIGLIEMNPEDNYLHLALTVVFLGLGFMKTADDNTNKNII